MLAETVNYIFGLATVAGILLIAFFFISFFIFKRENPVLKFLERHGILVAFLISLGAMLGSLLYSLVIGFPPCDLCWYQRVFMYPLVFILGLGWFRKEKVVAFYGLVLALLGFLIALYHTFLQSSVGGSLPCPSTGVSCAKRFVFEFGFVTIPLMALVTFSLIIISLYVVNRKKM